MKARPQLHSRHGGLRKSPAQQHALGQLCLESSAHLGSKLFDSDVDTFVSSGVKVTAVIGRAYFVVTALYELELAILLQGWTRNRR